MIYAVRLKEDINKGNTGLGHKAGRFLLRYGLLKEYGIDLKECTILKNEYGKPYLKEYSDVFFNISHCKTMAVCVFGNVPVGIDVEVKRSCKDGLMKRVLSEEEYERVKTANTDELQFIKYWTLKEAYGKAAGMGMLYDYANMTFRIDDKTVGSRDKEYRMWQLIQEDEFIISVCRKQTEEFEEDIEFVEMNYNELEAEQ